MKLGISKKQLLDDPKIKMLYEQYVKKQSGQGKIKGMGLFDGFVDFLKSSKILSNVGGVLLPVAAGALGGLVGTSLGGPAGTATGAAAGAAAGKSGADYIKSLGFGKVGRGGMSNLSISPQGGRLGEKIMKTKIKGKGRCMCGGAVTFGYNGIYQQIPNTPPGIAISQKGGQTSAFNTVASQFGNVKY